MGWRGNSGGGKGGGYPNGAKRRYIRGEECLGLERYIEHRIEIASAWSNNGTSVKFAQRNHYGMENRETLAIIGYVASLLVSSYFYPRAVENRSNNRFQFGNIGKFIVYASLVTRLFLSPCLKNLNVRIDKTNQFFYIIKQSIKKCSNRSYYLNHICIYKTLIY